MPDPSQLESVQPIQESVPQAPDAGAEQNPISAEEGVIASEMSQVEEREGEAKAELESIEQLAAMDPSLGGDAAGLRKELEGLSAKKAALVAKLEEIKRQVSAPEVAGVEVLAEELPAAVEVQPIAESAEDKAVSVEGMSKQDLFGALDGEVGKLNAFKEESEMYIRVPALADAATVQGFLAAIDKGLEDIAKYCGKLIELQQQEGNVQGVTKAKEAMERLTANYDDKKKKLEAVLAQVAAEGAESSTLEARAMKRATQLVEGLGKSSREDGEAVGDLGVMLSNLEKKPEIVRQVIDAVGPRIVEAFRSALQKDPARGLDLSYQTIVGDSASFGNIAGIINEFNPSLGEQLSALILESESAKLTAMTPEKRKDGFYPKQNDNLRQTLFSAVRKLLGGEQLSDEVKKGLAGIMPFINEHDEQSKNGESYLSPLLNSIRYEPKGDEVAEMPETARTAGLMAAKGMLQLPKPDFLALVKKTLSEVG